MSNAITRPSHGLTHAAEPAEKAAPPMTSVEITQRRATHADWRRGIGVIDAGLSTSRAAVAGPLQGAGGGIEEVTNPSGMTVGFL